MFDLKQEFPIPSQTSDADKLALLQIRCLVSGAGTYSYLEIGSFLGGSLTPFLRDPKCTRILSIDARGRDQPDERGCTFNYGGITHGTMLETLQTAGFTLDKIETFDGSMDEYDKNTGKFDLIFIDGEHTDRACFRDFVHARRFLKDDGVVAFHDSTLVHKSLGYISEMLRAQEKSFKFLKVKHAEMSFLFFGTYARVDVTDVFDAEEDLEDFHARAEEVILRSVVSNRVRFSRDGDQSVETTIIEPPSVKGF